MKITVSRTCPHCNTVLSEDHTPPVPAEPPHQMTCPSCGKEFTTSYAGYVVPKTDYSGLGGCLVFIIIFAIVAGVMSSGSNKDSDKSEVVSSQIPTGGKPTNPEAEQVVKTVINLNGQLCAEIVSVRPLVAPDMAQVTCIEYTGGKGKVTYDVNLKTAEVKVVE